MRKWGSIYMEIHNCRKSILHSGWVLYCLFKYLAFRNHIYHNTEIPAHFKCDILFNKKHIFYQQHKQHSSQTLVIVQAVVDMNKLYIISSTPPAYYYVFFISTFFPFIIFLYLQNGKKEIFKKKWENLWGS